jgi:hypothetical protein
LVIVQFHGIRVEAIWSPSQRYSGPAF